MKRVRTVERNRPFYAESVYAAMKELRMIARTEWRQSNPDRPITGKNWNEVEVNRDKIIEAVEKTCDAIRERIGSLNVID